MTLTCPHCGKSIDSTESATAASVLCPACGETFAVPQESGNQADINTVVASADGKTGEELLAALLATDDGGKYKIGDIVGCGGQGVVLNARDTNLRRNVAMKVMPASSRNRKEHVARFIEEAQVTSQIPHPSIVPIHELGVDAQGNVFYTMKMIEGVTLEKILHDLKDLPPGTECRYSLGRLLNIFLRICDGIAFAHSRGVIHRDLKPENVMVGDYGEVLVLDWGLAKVLPRDGSPGTATGQRTGKSGESGIESVRGDDQTAGWNTMAGDVMGTPRFMAPEQAKGEIDRIDEKTDVYALGGILYNILALAPPVTGEGTRQEVLDEVIAGRVPDPLKRKDLGNLAHCPRGRIPKPLAAVAMKALSARQTHRYQSVKELQAEAEAYQGGFATKAEHAGFLRRSGLLIKRHKAVTAIASVVLASTLVTGWVYFGEKLKRVARWGLGKDITPQTMDQLQRDWPLMQNRWTVEEGKICVPEDVNGSAYLYYGRLIHGNVALEFDAVVDDEESLAKGGDLSMVLTSDAAPTNTYHLLVGGQYNSLAAIHKQDERIPYPQVKVCTDYSLEPKRVYHIRGEKTDEWLRLYCDGELILEYRDLFYLAVDRVGLYTFCGGKKFWNIRLYEQHVPEVASPLSAGDELVRRSRTKQGAVRDGYLKEALEDYSRVATSFPGHDLEQQALLKMGYVNLRVGDTVSAKTNLKRLGTTSVQSLLLRGEIAFSENNFEEAHAAYRQVKNEYPAARMEIVSQLRSHLSGSDTEQMDNTVRQKLWRLYAENLPKGTMVDCASAGLDSLEFLRGLKFEELRCQGNSITSLEPLRGMPLRRLRCNDNRIADIGPLRGMQLTNLRCGMNLIENLEPLRGMPLVELGCHSNRIKDLGPLKGMPLTELYFFDNQVEDLESLKGMPLRLFHCNSNRIKSLEPLRGMRLDVLYCQGNLIEDLEPLRDTPPGEFRFNNNSIRNYAGFETSSE